MRHENFSETFTPGKYFVALHSFRNVEERNGESKEKSGRSEDSNGTSAARSSQGQVASDFSTGLVEVPDHRPTGTRHGRHRLHRTAGRRRRGRAGSDGSRQRLFRGHDAGGRADRRENGFSVLRFDRKRDRESRGFDGRVDGSRS